MARRAIQTISHNGREYFSLNHASSLCGYHRDYLGQLIRTGKLTGEKIGSSWFLEKQVFTRFCEENHTASFSRPEESIKIDPVNQDLLKEVQELKTKLAKFETRKVSSVNSRQDPWDELLLGENFQSAGKLRFAELLNSFSFNTALLKPAILIVAVSAAGVFAARNPQMVSGLVDDISLALDKFQTKAELSLNKISLPEISLPDYSDYFSLAQAQKISSLDFKGLAVSAQNFLENSFLNLGQKSGVLVNQKGEKAIKTLTGLPQKAGEAAGRVLNQTKDKLASLPKQVLNLFKPRTPSEITVSAPQSEEPKLQLSPTEEGGLKEELSKLLEQGLTSEPSVKVEQTVVERTIEKVISGLSEKELDTAIAGVNSKLLAEVSALKSLIQQRSDENFRAIALSNRINNLSGVTINNTTVSGTISGIEDDDVPNDISVNTSKHLSGTSAAFTSNVTVSGTLDVTGALTANAISFSNASTSLSSVFNTLYVGGTATTTITGTTIAFDTTGSITAGTAGGLSIPYASSTALTISGTASTTNFLASAMTSGSVLFAGAGGLLSQDNSNLFWDDTNNRLGIASTSPFGLLSVEQGTETHSFYVANTGSSTPSFVINGVNGMGRVGIGTSSPSSKFTVEQPNEHGGILVQGGSPQLKLFTNDVTTEQRAGYISFGLGAGTETFGGGLADSHWVLGRAAERFYIGFTTNSNPHNAINTAASILSVDRSGKVGIGSTDLVDSSTYFDAVLQLASSTATTMFRVDDSGDGDTSPFIIDGDGNVGIGTTTPGA
ncbi:MAG TPA: hypothetical protein VJJ27_00670, partial [Candidatus Paceibacterota bacterium]